MIRRATPWVAALSLAGCGVSSKAEPIVLRTSEPSSTTIVVVDSPATTSTTTTSTTTTSVPAAPPTTAVPPTTQNIFGDVLAGVGSTGADVVLAQRALATLGLDVGAIDGVWGPGTQLAWDRFEMSAQSILPADGVFTSAELVVISGYANLYEPPPVPTAPPATIPPEPVGPTEQCQSTIESVRRAGTSLASSPTVSKRDDFSGRYFEVPNKLLTDAYLTALRSLTSACGQSWPEAATAASQVVGCLGYSTLNDCRSQDEALKQLVAGSTF